MDPIPIQEVAEDTIGAVSRRDGSVVSLLDVRSYEVRLTRFQARSIRAARDVETVSPMIEKIALGGGQGLTIRRLKSSPLPKSVPLIRISSEYLMIRPITSR